MIELGRWPDLPPPAPPPAPTPPPAALLPPARVAELQEMAADPEVMATIRELADLGADDYIRYREDMKLLGLWPGSRPVAPPPTLPPDLPAELLYSYSSPRGRLLSSDTATGRASMGGTPPGSYPVPLSNGEPPRYPINWRSTDGRTWSASPRDEMDYWFAEDAAMGRGQTTHTARRSPDALPPGQAFYREHQGLTLDCGKHSLNTYFGGPVLTDGREFNDLNVEYLMQKFHMEADQVRALDISGGSDPEVLGWIIRKKVQEGQIGPAWSRNFQINGNVRNPPPMGSPGFQSWAERVDSFRGDRIMVMHRRNYNSGAHFFTLRRHTDGTWQLVDGKMDVPVIFDRLSDWMMNKQNSIMTFMHQEPGFRF